MNPYIVTITRPTRRDQVKPGDRFQSSHGYALLVTSVRDDAESRTDDRHVELVGHLHARAGTPLRNERYPAGSLVPVSTQRAVATLDEARTFVSTWITDRWSFNPAFAKGDGDLYRPEARACFELANALPTEGGTVGPLPDETVIEVAAVSLDLLDASDPRDSGGVEIGYVGWPTNDDEWTYAVTAKAFDAGGEVRGYGRVTGPDKGVWSNEAAKVEARAIAFQHALEDPGFMTKAAWAWRYRGTAPADEYVAEVVAAFNAVREARA